MQAQNDTQKRFKITLLLASKKHSIGKKSQKSDNQFIFIFGPLRDKLYKIYIIYFDSNKRLRTKVWEW